MRIPPLETERLTVREFSPTDLDAAHQLLDFDLAETDSGTDGALSRAARLRWLEWSTLNYEQLAYLRQPPYGDRAIVLRSSGALVGACGLVPCLAPFELIPTLHPPAAQQLSPPGRFSPEVGLYWAVSPTFRRQGIATEAGRALVDYAFQALQLDRIVATTSHDNTASIGVMRKLGMRIDRNPFPEPRWFQVVGILRHDQWPAPDT